MFSQELIWGVKFSENIRQVGREESTLETKEGIQHARSGQNNSYEFRPG